MSAPTVDTERAEQYADDLLLRRLKKSVRMTCLHKNAVTHHEGQTPDTGEWYKAQHCESCGHEWVTYE